MPWSPATPSGVNHVVMNVAREIRKSGRFEPMILVTDWQHSSPAFDHLDGIRTVKWRAYTKPLRIRNLQDLLEQARFLWFVSRLRRFLRAHDVRAINVHYPTNASFALAQAVHGNEDWPLLISFHGADAVEIAREPQEVRERWAELLARSCGAATCSDSLGDDVRRAIPGPYRLTTIHNGIDVDSFIGEASDRPLVAGRYVLNVAGFQAHKGQDTLLRSFARVAAEHPDVRLVLAGGEAEFLPALRGLCRELGLEARVDFFVNASHATVATLMKFAAVFCLPSRREPFGIVLLEAGAFGVPIIASRVGGIPEVLADGESGILLPPDNDLAWSNALCALLRTGTPAASLGQALSTRVRTEFSWSTTADRIVNTLSCA